MKVVKFGMDTVFHYKTLECKTDDVTFLKSQTHKTTDRQTTANNIYKNFKSGHERCLGSLLSSFILLRII